jgi:hypothetical protein
VIKKHIINSTDFNLTYCFFAPIVSLLWNKRIGYSPITLFYEREAAWTSSELYRLVLESTKKFSEAVHIAAIPQIRSSTIAQVSCLYASALDLPNASYLLTSDIDMIPIQAAVFHSQNPTKAFHIFGADAYAPTSQFPICYLGGTLNAWRDVMGIETLDLSQNLLSTMDPTTDYWNFDEEWFADRMKRWDKFETDCELIQRGWIDGRAKNRIDRVAWKFNGEVGDLIDCHSLRPGFLWSNWVSIRTLLAALLPSESMKWIDDYRAQFVNLLIPMQLSPELHARVQRTQHLPNISSSPWRRLADRFTMR